MKKVLAICSIFFTVCTAFTSCGSGDKTYDSNPDNRTTTMYGTTAGEYVSDAIHGAGKAGNDLIDGVTDAAGALVDGLDGEDDTRSTVTTMHTSR